MRHSSPAGGITADQHPLPMARYTETQPPQDDDWEAKYRTLLHDATAAENQWRKFENILKRGLSRLTLLIPEGDPGVDAQLDQLRAKIREGEDLPDICERLDRVSGLANRVVHPTVRDAPGAASSRHAPGDDAVPWQVFVNSLRRQELLSANDEEGYAKRLAEASARDAQRAVIEDLAASIHGFVTRQLETGTTQQTREPIDAGDLNRALLDVLEALPVPPALDEEAERIKQALQTDFSEANLPHTLEDFLSLSANIRRNVREQANEFQRFLRSVSDKLKDIEQHVELYSKHSAESADNTRTMGDTVRADLKHIQISLDSENDISRLKQSVQSDLESIEVSIAAGILKQEQASSKTQSEINRLLNRMEELENETCKLRVQVTQERARAMRDPLTDLYNRAALDQQLEQEVNRCTRYGVPFSIIVWDLDHFKKVNDEYGHPAGDKVIKAFGGLLQRRQRETDFVARYGGEEFVCLLPETDLPAARALAEEIRGRIASSNFRYRGNKVPISVSAGVTCFQPTDTAEAMLARADAALYQAKQNGRNQVHTDPKLPGQ